MFSTLLERMGSVSRGSARPDVPRASSSDSLNSAATGGAFSNALASSTPPTSVGDSVSISSTSLSLDKETAQTPATEDSSGRSRRARKSVGTYNLKALAGTSIHAPRKYGKAAAISELETRRRTISGETMVAALASGNSSTATVEKDAARLVRDGIDALDLQWSVKKLPKSKSEIDLSALARQKAEAEELATRKSTRLAGERVESLTKKLSVLGKRGRKTFEGGLAKASRELRKLADTNEFAHIDTKPVLHEVWSNGKLVTPEEPQKKKKRIEPPAQLLGLKTLPEAPKPVEEKKKPEGKREKVWLTKGLYAGQQGDIDWSAGFSDKEKENMNSLVPTKPRKFLPLPIWHGERLLNTGRNFKLPFDVCSPLPPGQPKPDEWRKSTRNRFIGDAALEWKTTKHFGDFDSRCVCTSAEGCGDNCQNRIMFYECDEMNCAIGRGCGNRAFADLQERRKGGNKYEIGVEVIKTADRGYGVRSNRCFEPDQIIVEYNGEIITEEECDRRMNEEYKNNECYYLMAFDQNMIIDATTGSIARFVNHSCTPNCKMVKWIVAGKPRMALFAKEDRPIMTGEELTYDYNFDPFSAKNVQECRCGSANCRGFLGPKPKDVKPPKESAIKEAVRAGVKAGKRKLKELMGGDEDEANASSPKKRKLKEAKGLKRSASSASMRVAAKGAAKVLKRSVSTQLLNVRQAVASKRGNIPVKSKKASILKTYGKGQTKLASRNSSLTIVAAGSPESKKSKTSKTSKTLKTSKASKASKASKIPKTSGVRRPSVAKNVVRNTPGASNAGVSDREVSIKVVRAAGEAEEDVEESV